MSNVSKYWLDPHQSVLVVIDIQERLVPTMDKKVYQAVKGNVELLIEAARVLNIPVIVTEQYPKGLGSTVPELAERCAADPRIEKLSFGCCGEPTFMEQLQQLGRSQVLVTGMEAHVCVYQTVLGLLEAGFNVHLVRDAICSRGKRDFRNALELSRGAGAVVTTAETVAFQLLKVAGSPEFKAISKLIREK